MKKPFLAGLRISTSACAVLFWALLATGLAQSASGPASDSMISRHPLETRALVDPEGVLKELPALLQHAAASKDHKELALLYLAKSNACRVIADWECQSNAAESARSAADSAGLPELQVRSLIAESRGRMPLQDFSR
ncbi:MAG: hypothetical protein ABIP02_00070, partial [Arenimonas sp.]